MFFRLLNRNIETDVKFPEKGSNSVEAVKYENEKVWINKAQYFENIPETAWNFHIGGYQVLQKWLKDRRGRTLSFDDLEHHSKVILALSKTIELMQTIDEPSKKTAAFRLNESRTIFAAEVRNNRRLIYAEIGREIKFMQTVREIYRASIRPLGEGKNCRLRLLFSKKSRKSDNKRI